MKINIVPIGNSKGVRIPKMILKQCHITETVDLQVKGKMIIIKPLDDTPRKGWGEMFKAMAEQKDDRLLIDDSIDITTEEWEW
jgi:antitoxin MazE